MKLFLKKKCVLGKSIEAVKLFKLLDPFVDFNKKGMPLLNLKKDKDTQTHSIVFFVCVVYFVEISICNAYLTVFNL